MKEDLLKIFNHYEYRHQQRKLNEEVFELIEAIRDYEEEYIRSDCDEKYIQYEKKHIEEEFADVMVLLTQIKYYYELDSERIEKIMKEKIARQLERMKNE